ncbi:MAG: DUF4118 domain-containing protein [Bryobacteraceae bacterium]
MSKELRLRQDSVDWVEKLARQDWSAFQNGDLGCIIAVARKRLWDEFTFACQQIAESYEQEYLRRVYWSVGPAARGNEEERREATIYKASLLEKGTPDRLLLEVRFDTDLPAIYFSTLDPFETNGVIMLVLDEVNEVRLCYRGVLMSASELARFLLAPVLFRVNVHHPQLADDVMDLARLRGAYGEATLMGRPTGSLNRPMASPRPAPQLPKLGPSTTWLTAFEIPKPNWLRYALSAVTVLVATGLLFLLQSLTPVPIFWLLSGVIGFVFVQWGFGPGILALAMGTAATDYFFVEPLYEFDFNSTTRLLGLAYALMAFSAYWVSTRRRSNPVS